MRSIRNAAGAAVIVAVAGFALPAAAVDLVNRDRVEREAVVNRNDGQSDVVTLKPGQRIADICTSCVILVGDTSVEATGRAVAVIAGGKVTIGR